MSDTPPDRLSVNPSSEHYEPEHLGRGIGIRFNGKEKTNVEEYSVQDGWIKVAAGNSRDRHGNPMMITLKGKVEPYYENPPSDDEGDD
ncbi:MAG: DUF3297 family protein [Pacificimonas sp.]